jgi:hypothetical protein
MGGKSEEVQWRGVHLYLQVKYQSKNPTEQ